MTVGPDVVDVLVDDHREIEMLLSQWAEDERRLTVGLAELARHIVVEEEYLYPVVRERVERGDRLAEDGLSLSGDAERLMQRLEQVTAADRAPLVEELLDLVRRHAATTEHELFPALRRAIPPDQLDHLAGVVEMAKRTAPTHAHPGAPTTPPWNQILSPGIGLVDKVRDALSRRSTRPEDL